MRAYATLARIRCHCVGRLNSGVMPHTKLHRYSIIFLLAACAGCTDYSSDISDQLNANGRNSIDLMQAVPIKWDKVCILGPYSGDNEAEKILGFEWPAESRTDIEDSDGITLLLFVRDKSVIEYVEHPRDQGDFSRLDSRCFKASSAKFRSVTGSHDNWSFLVPASEA